MALFGTGVMKGPFAIDKEYPNWDVTKVNIVLYLKLYHKLIMYLCGTFILTLMLLIWMKHNMLIERHKMSRTELRALKRRPYFRETVIEEAIDDGENYVKKYWEDDLTDYNQENYVDRFEVLEYWGMIDVEMLLEQQCRNTKRVRRTLKNYKLIYGFVMVNYLEQY